MRGHRLPPFVSGPPDTFCTCSVGAEPQNHLDVPGRCYRALKPGACRMHHTFREHLTEPSEVEARMDSQEVGR